jgi:hypothetical protein
LPLGRYNLARAGLAFRTIRDMLDGAVHDALPVARRTVRGPVLGERALLAHAFDVA